MTTHLLKFIRAECSNYNFNKCIDNGCFAHKKQCAYFERCLVGLKQYKTNPKYPMWEKGISMYLGIHKKKRKYK